MATPNSIPPADIDYFSYDTYVQTANYLRGLLPPTLKTIEVGIICGSGLNGLGATLEEPRCEFEYKDIPHFAVSTVQGHVGKLIFGFLSGRPTVAMVGRKHLYEGHSLMRTVFPVRIMRLLGAHTLIVTNAAGSLNPSFNVGDVMVIADHISMAGMGGQNALIGPNVSKFGPRFPPVSDAYDFELRKTAFKAARAVGIPKEAMREGVYCFVAGPSYETRAEARFLKAAGGDCVGMSTVPEVVVARHCGLRVLGITLITNKVAQGYGRSALQCAEEEMKKEHGASNGSVEHASSPVPEDDEKLLANHEEVLEISKARSEAMQGLVRKIVDQDALTLAQAPTFQLYGINYGPRRTQDTCASDAEILNDLRLISQITTRVKTFHLIDDPPTSATALGEDINGCVHGRRLLKAARALADGGDTMELYLGLWFKKAADGGSDGFEKEMGELNLLMTEMPDAFSKHVKAVVVGSEAVFRGDITPEALIERIRLVRGALAANNFHSVKITVADVGGAFYPDTVVSAVDVVMPNYYPFWQGVEASNAVNFQVGLMADMQARVQRIASAGTKEVWLGETGWPTAGENLGAAVPTVRNMIDFYKGWICKARSTPELNKYFWFEAFDELWKPNNHGVEQNWGLFYANRTIKSQEILEPT
ncbi:hypothetical protein HK102_009388, partial [Quaeritorhiza haematococci]